MLGSKLGALFLLPFGLYSAAARTIVENVSSENDQLIFAQIIFRHGDRNPLVSYPNDPWRESIHWPRGYGELINDGKMRLYELGKYFRNRYQSLLKNGTYSNNVVYIQSTDIDRTLMSAESALAGFFPPIGGQIWNKDLAWQPVPVHTIPKNIDFVLNAEAPCPRFNEALKKYEESPEHRALFTKHKALIEYLEENTGMKLPTLDDIQNLNNTLWIQSVTNKTLPEWTKKVFPGGDLAMLAARCFKTNTSTPELARLKAGFLYREILDHFSQKIESNLRPNRSLWIYSAHDSTIASILNSIGLFELHSPPYAATLMFELYKSNSGFYFQLLYRKWNNEHLTPLNIPLCGTKCTIEQFRKAYREILPTKSIAEECGL